MTQSMETKSANTVQEVKMRSGPYMIPVKIEEKGNRLFFDFPFNRELKDEIKAMEGAKWHGYDQDNPRKIWSAKKSARNWFQIQFLCHGSTDLDPYNRYDLPLNTAVYPKERFNESKKKTLQLFKHTAEMAAHLFMRRQCILAGEMGTAKTIACILALEKVAEKWLNDRTTEEKNAGKSLPKIVYVAPRSALRAVQREFVIWNCELRWQIEFITYEGLTKWVKQSEEKDITGLVLVLDESSKVKNPQSQRSQAAKIVADRFRQSYPVEACIWLMSGSPAPKSPVDWWSQAEIACPGFLKEGDEYKFKNRLGIVINKTDISGGSYPVLLGWRDDVKKCNICGQESVKHFTEILDHSFIASKNEIEILYKRLKGLVYIKFKKDCLDLPEKNYRTIELKPTNSMVRVAKGLVKTAGSTIEALTKLRELSDGFQYQEVEDGRESCSLCLGKGKCFLPEAREGEEYGIHLPDGEPKLVEQDCPNCQGKGTVKKFKRTYKEVPCPKDEALVDLLDEYEDVGRVVIYAGFTASIDRCVKIALRQKWAVIRVDQGKDSIISQEGKPIADDYLNVFQDKLQDHPRVAFIAHPGSAGLGLTLTASPVIIYFSNDFNAENRIQSEDRIHRPGMDPNRGALIIDLVHLPSDIKILDNLKKKRILQSMSLGDVQKFIEETEGVER